MRQRAHPIFLTFIPLFLVLSGHARGEDDAAEMARKLQNPLANIKALITDNVIGFNTGDDGGTSFGFQLQPVYAFDFPDRKYTLISRAVIPITGIEPGTRGRNIGEDGQPTPSGGDRVWGLADSIVQLFFAPYVDSDWKWGIGPQLSIPTHTDSDLEGPGWGAGVTGVLVGNITEQLNLSILLSNQWGFDGKFNQMSFQPMLFYNIESIPGAYLTYNAVILADWKADAGNRWTVPLGMGIGRTFSLGGGRGFDVMVGPYYNIVRPDGAADWTLRFGVNWLFD